MSQIPILIHASLGEKCNPTAICTPHSSFLAYLSITAIPPTLVTKRCSLRLQSARQNWYDQMRPEQGKRNSSDNLSWFQNMPHISHSSKSSSLLLSCFQRDFFFNFTIFTGSIVSGYIYNSVMTLSKVFCLRQFKILLRHRSNKNPFSKIQNFCCKLVSKEDMDLCHKT